MDESNIARAVGLALIKKDEKEQKELLKDVQDILKYVEDVQSIEVVENDASRINTNIFREDVISVPAYTFTKQMLDQAPAKYKEWFLSKKIL